MNAVATPTQETSILALRDKLAAYDVIAVFDATGSMDEKLPNGMTRWAGQKENALGVCKAACMVDADGIGMVFFEGNNITSFDGVTNDKVNEIYGKFGPGGGTYMAPALAAAFKLAGKSDKKDVILFFTDGQPNDPTETEAAIIAHTKTMNADNETTILFIQVGNDTAATAWLKKLDDGLQAKGAKFDIVDTLTIDKIGSMPIELAIANAIVD